MSMDKSFSFKRHSKCKQVDWYSQNYLRTFYHHNLDGVLYHQSVHAFFSWLFSN